MAFDFRRIDCPTCETDDVVLLGRRGGDAHRAGAGEVCNIVRCRRCSLLYPNPFPFPTDSDALYGDPDAFFSAHGDQQAKIEGRERLVAGIERMTSGRRLLDVGAGLGETVAAALRRGWDAHGVETSSSFAAKASELTNGRVIHASLEDAPAAITKEPYDAVVLAAVLEHLHEPSRVLGHVAKLLKPGGVVFLDVPNESALFFRVGNLWNQLQGRDWVVNLAPTFSPYHVFGFNKRSLTAMLNKHGLDLEGFTVFEGRPQLPLQVTPRGVAEWVATHALHAVTKYGEQGGYIKGFGRKR